MDFQWRCQWHPMTACRKVVRIVEKMTLQFLVLSDLVDLSGFTKVEAPGIKLVYDLAEFPFFFSVHLNQAT